jgi:hypothetical protein
VKQIVKNITNYRTEYMDLHIHSPIPLHGIGLNKFSTGTTLSFTELMTKVKLKLKNNNNIKLKYEYMLALKSIISLVAFEENGD